MDYRNQICRNWIVLGLITVAATTVAHVNAFSFDTIVFSTTFCVMLPVAVTMFSILHELGHYRAARRHGVEIEAVRIGRGPLLSVFRDRNGVPWALRWPTGFGSISLYGETSLCQEIPAARRDRAYCCKLPSTRAEIIREGLIASLLYPTLTLTITFALFDTPFEPFTRIIAAYSASEAADIYYHWEAMLEPTFVLWLAASISFLLGVINRLSFFGMYTDGHILRLIASEQAGGPQVRLGSGRFSGPAGGWIMICVALATFSLAMVIAFSRTVAQPG